MTSGPLHRSAGDPDTLVVPLKKVPEGWYLVYWRAISVDGHPVRGVLHLRRGPEPGPGAAVPGAVDLGDGGDAEPRRGPLGRVPLRHVGDRAVRVPDPRSRGRSCGGATDASLRRVSLGVRGRRGGRARSRSPSTSLLATAEFALRSAFAIGDLVPLFDDSAFGRGYLDLELCFALFVAAAAVALWVDRPDREHRSIAELLATLGALAAAAAVLVVPARRGTRRRRLRAASRSRSTGCTSISGSVWLGGLVGLLVLWREPARRPPRCRARDRRAALLQRRLRLGARAARHRDLGDGEPHADRSRRSGRPRTAR